MSASTESYLKELLDEEEILDPVQCRHTLSLLKHEISRVGGNVLDCPSGSKMVESKTIVLEQYEKAGQEYINLQEKIFYPENKEPSYDFVVSLIGPKGSNIKNLAQNTNTKISILGKGSTKDKHREEELCESSEPEHQHFKEPFHVLIQAAGPKHVVAPGLNAAVNQIKKCMASDVKYNTGLHSQNSSSSTQYDDSERVNLSEKLFFPDNSSSDFVTRLLGPKGINLRNIAKSTKTRISILGKGSIRDKSEEAELLRSNDPNYAHLKEPLHALIQVAGARYIAQSRLNSALIEMKKYIKVNERYNEQRIEDTSNKLPRTPFDNDEHIQLREKVFIPVEKYPTANFIGTLLGVKGMNLKGIATSTRAKISILGQGSMGKEKEHVNMNDPKYEHLSEPLHVLIQVAGPRKLAKGRLNAALFEINRCIDEEVRRQESHADASNSSLPANRSSDDEEFTELTSKVYFPVDEHPSFNFIGRLLGPKGSNLKNIASSSKFSSTKTNISISGKGSTKDPSNDPNEEPLHASVTVSGPKYAAEPTFKSVLDEIKKYTDPENGPLVFEERYEYRKRASPTLTHAHLSDYPRRSNYPYGRNGLDDFIWSEYGKKCRISYE